MGHFHKGWGFVNMHEAAQCILINNSYFQKVIVMHVLSVSNLLLTIHMPLP